jgi:hypothetical protein
VCEDSDEGNHPGGLQVLENIGRHDSLGHAAGGNGRNDVAEDIVLQTLFCERLGEANKGKFGS